MNWNNPSDQEAASNLFTSAQAVHRAGRLDEAEHTYRQLLTHYGANADTLHMLALIQHQKGNLQDAELLILQALAQREDARFLVDLGLLLQATNRLPNAEAAFKRALVVVPDFVPAHYNLGTLYEEQLRLWAAERSFRRVVTVEPGHIDAQAKVSGLPADRERRLLGMNVRLGANSSDWNFGIAASTYREGKRAETEMILRQITAVDDQYVHAHHSLGLVMREQGDLNEAEIHIRKAITLQEDTAFLNNLGNLLKESDRKDEAEACYRRILILKPNDTLALYNLGGLLREAKCHIEAEQCYRRAIAVDPYLFEPHNNLGLLLQDLRRLPESKLIYQHAIAIQPNSTDAYFNLATLLQDTGRIGEAESVLLRALEIDPRSAVANANFGYLLLSASRYSEAWKFYEFRNAPGMDNAIANPELPFPAWRGEHLAGKSFLVWFEQGFGDMIQFSRYIPLLKARGVTSLTLVCMQQLKPLLETVEGVDEVISDIGPMRRFDYWSLPMSLPLHFSTSVDNIPAKIPYLFAQREYIGRWHGRMPTDGIKVGLVWKGNPKHKNDAERSLPGLSTLLPLWSVRGITFISLQKGAGEDEAEACSLTQPLISLGEEFGDFGDTAAVIAQLDLVICVDTAIAHVAGALGIPCWVLLPKFRADWRWMLDRSDSPWYPTTRLFRQAMRGDWQSVIEEVTHALQQMRSRL